MSVACGPIDDESWRLIETGQRKLTKAKPKAEGSSAQLHYSRTG
jgi:hypothetical protein